MPFIGSSALQDFVVGSQYRRYTFGMCGHKSPYAFLTGTLTKIDPLWDGEILHKQFRRTCRLGNVVLFSPNITHLRP